MPDAEVGQALAKEPRAVAQAVVEVCVALGEADAARRLMKFVSENKWPVTVRISAQLTAEADVSLCLLDYAELLRQGQEGLREFLTRVAELTREWGKWLWPAERSVFVVLYNWEKCAGEMAFPELLEWLEERKSEWLVRLQAIWARCTARFYVNPDRAGSQAQRENATETSAPVGQDVVATPGGFGQVKWRIWAVSLREKDDPRLSDLPLGFGVGQLFRQVCVAALEYASRRRRQTYLAWCYLLLGLVALVGFLTGIILLAGRYHRPVATVTTEEDPTRHLPSVERYAWWVDRGRRLLRWEEWHQGGAFSLDWPSWLEAVQKFQRMTTWLPKLESEEERVWERALHDVRAQLGWVYARACVLGVEGAGQLSLQEGRPGKASFAFPLGLPPVGEQSGLFQTRQPNALEAFLREVSERRKQVHEHFPEADLRLLPGDLPNEVAEDLRQLAEQRYLAVLEPVRAEIRRQVLRLGEGRETLAAWRELVQRGWLGGAARRELAEWLSVVQMLQAWSGREMRDPLDELVQFVLQETVPLPLGRLWLSWPEMTVEPLPGQTARLQEPPSQLLLTFSSPGERATTLSYQRFDASTGQFGRSRRWEYRLATQVSWPGECYLYRPGVSLRIEARVKDAMGKTWQIRWSEREARSQVFGFTVLELTPRCHVPEEPVEAGVFLHGVRLHLSVPLPIPDLLP